MDRDFIERQDFASADDGYDPDEVQTHLRDIARALDKIHFGRAKTLSDTTAERVRAILDQGGDDANRLRAEARQAAAEMRRSAEDGAQEVIHHAVAKREGCRRTQRELKATLQVPHEVVDSARERASACERRLDQLAGSFEPIIKSARGMRDDVKGLQRALRTLAEMSPPQPQELADPDEPAKTG